MAKKQTFSENLQALQKQLANASSHLAAYLATEKTAPKGFLDYSLLPTEENATIKKVTIDLDCFDTRTLQTMQGILLTGAGWQLLQALEELAKTTENTVSDLAVAIGINDEPVADGDEEDE